MQDERQEWISKRAYSLWEASGRQHGKDHEHWEQAVREPLKGIRPQIRLRNSTPELGDI